MIPNGWGGWGTSRQKVWTDEKLNWIRDNVKMYDDREDILSAFNNHFGTQVTLELFRNKCNMNKIKIPKANRRIKHGLEIGWLKLRGFTEKNIGDEIRRGSKSQIHIKISNSNYATKSKHLYEKYHNVKLAKDDVVVFLNGNKNDYSISNLYKVSRRINAVVGKNKFYELNKLPIIKTYEWKYKIYKLLERNEE